MSQLEAQSPSPVLSKSSDTGRLLMLWLGAGVVLLLFLGHPSVTRTQEARVLETARQMLGQPIHRWLIPLLNAEPRLQKPPITYWMAIAAFTIGGVNEFAGRAPTVLCAWFTLLLTYLGGRSLFSSRAGLLSAGSLLSSYLFFRHARLAETDVPVMLCVTASTLAFWRAVDKNSALWFHIAAVFCGLAAMTKGLPCVFPLVFLLALILTTRNYAAGRTFLRSGALLTFLVVGCAWYVYVLHSIGTETLWKELRIIAAGRDHKAPPWAYLPMFFVATAPWCVIIPFVFWYAFTHRSDRRIHGLLLWVGSIFVPLCMAGNKQFHYLAPVMPPMFILTGAFLDLHLSERNAAIVVRACGIIALGFALVIGWWLPAHQTETPRDIARTISAELSDHPIVFFGYNRSLPLCFSLRRDIPSVYDAKQLMSHYEPGLIVIAQTKDNVVPPSMPDQFDPIRKIRTDEQTFEVYRAR